MFNILCYIHRIPAEFTRQWNSWWHGEVGLCWCSRGGASVLVVVLYISYRHLCQQAMDYLATGKGTLSYFVAFKIASKYVSFTVFVASQWYVSKVLYQLRHTYTLYIHIHIRFIWPGYKMHNIMKRQPTKKYKYHNTIYHNINRDRIL